MPHLTQSVVEDRVISDLNLSLTCDWSRNLSEVSAVRGFIKDRTPRILQFFEHLPPKERQSWEARRLHKPQDDPTNSASSKP
jgi:hypothetical protein